MSTCRTCGETLVGRKARYNRFCSRRCYGESLAFTPETFFARVSVGDADACWEWQGKRAPNGYGLAGHRGVGAHRIAYRITKGPIPDGFVVRHTCDNKPCVNPAHLEVGTQAENIADRDRRGRWQPARGEDSPSAKLTWRDVHAIRAAAADDAPRGTLTRLANEFGVTLSAIHDVVSGRNWRT